MTRKPRFDPLQGLAVGSLVPLPLLAYIVAGLWHSCGGLGIYVLALFIVLPLVGVAGVVAGAIAAFIPLGRARRPAVWLLAVSGLPVAAGLVGWYLSAPAAPGACG